MKIYKQENISNLYNDSGELVKTTTQELPVLYADEGKVIRHKKFKFITETFVVIGSNDSIDNYGEIDKSE